MFGGHGHGSKDNDRLFKKIEEDVRRQRAEADRQKKEEEKRKREEEERQKKSKYILFYIRS